MRGELQAHGGLIFKAGTDMTKTIDDGPLDVLTISPEQVCFVVVKARELNAKDESSATNSGSNASDDKEISILEDRPGDAVEAELRGLIAALSSDEQIDLVTLTWLGRGDGSAADWNELRDEAQRAHNTETASYLLGNPLLADHLEEGLSLLGFSCAEFEINRL
jgi:hypothetical protein